LARVHATRKEIGNLAAVADETRVADLSEAEMTRLVLDAAQEARRGELVRCESEQEVRDLMARLQRQPV
jgi:hypothetical protein